MTKDHLIPKSLGGSDNYENFALACAKCNRRRSNILIEWFRKESYESHNRTSQVPGTGYCSNILLF